MSAKLFEEPKGWQNKNISESKLINDFKTVWQQIKDKYQTELSALAYKAIPKENEVAACFEELIKRIK